MKSILICEGKTDQILFSYFLSSVYNWKSICTLERSQQRKLKGKLNIFKCNNNEQSIEWYIRDNDYLGIYASGSNTGIPDGIRQVLDLNKHSSNDAIDKLVVITDNDDNQVENKIISNIQKSLNEHNMNLHNDLRNNTWTHANYSKDLQIKVNSKNGSFT